MPGDSRRRHQGIARLFMTRTGSAKLLWGHSFGNPHNPAGRQPSRPHTPASQESETVHVPHLCAGPPRMAPDWEQPRAPMVGEGNSHDTITHGCDAASAMNARQQVTLPTWCWVGEARPGVSISRSIVECPQRGMC